MSKKNQNTAATTTQEFVNPSFALSNIQIRDGLKETSELHKRAGQVYDSIHQTLTTRGVDDQTSFLVGLFRGWPMNGNNKPLGIKKAMKEKGYPAAYWVNAYLAWRSVNYPTAKATTDKTKKFGKVLEVNAANLDNVLKLASKFLVESGLGDASEHLIIALNLWDTENAVFDKTDETETAKTGTDG